MAGRTSSARSWREPQHDHGKHLRRQCGEPTVNSAGPGTYNPIRCNAGAINDCYPTLGQTGIPFVIPSSGTMGNNGALAVTTALDYAYPASYVRLPAGAIQTGSAAGWYYAVWSSASTATVYNNPTRAGIQ